MHRGLPINAQDFNSASVMMIVVLKGGSLAALYDPFVVFTILVFILHVAVFLVNANNVYIAI